MAKWLYFMLWLLKPAPNQHRPFGNATQDPTNKFMLYKLHKLYEETNDVHRIAVGDVVGVGCRVRI